MRDWSSGLPRWLERTQSVRSGRSPACTCGAQRDAERETRRVDRVCSTRPVHGIKFAARKEGEVRRVELAPPIGDQAIQSVVVEDLCVQRLIEPAAVEPVAGTVVVVKWRGNCA